MKRIISLLIALLIGALASWNTQKAPVTPQNAGFEAITAEVEEQTAEEESPAEALVEETVTEEEQDEPTAVLIEPEETEAFAPEPPVETEPTKLMVGLPYPAHHDIAAGADLRVDMSTGRRVGE